MQRRIAEELKWKDVKLVLCEQTISTLLKQCLELVGIQAIQDIGHSEVFILSDIFSSLSSWDVLRLLLLLFVELLELLVFLVVVFPAKLLRRPNFIL